MYEDTSHVSQSEIHREGGSHHHDALRLPTLSFLHLVISHSSKENKQKKDRFDQNRHFMKTSCYFQQLEEAS